MEDFSQPVADSETQQVIKDLLAKVPEAEKQAVLEQYMRNLKSFVKNADVQSGIEPSPEK